MTTRIEKGRAKLVIDPLDIGKTAVSVFIDGAAFTILLDPEDAKVAGEALRRRK